MLKPSSTCGIAADGAWVFMSGPGSFRSQLVAGVFYGLGFALRILTVRSLTVDSATWLNSVLLEPGHGFSVYDFSKLRLLKLALRLLFTGVIRSR